MSDFFEIFNPGQRYTREQLETEKLLVVNEAQGGTGPKPLDLDSGSVVVRLPASVRETPDAETTTPPLVEPVETKTPRETPDAEPNEPAG